MPRRETPIKDPIATHVIRRALAAVRSDVCAIVQEALTSQVGRPRVQTWRVLLVLMMIAALEADGSLMLTKVNRVADRLSHKQRRLIGMERDTNYSQVDRALTTLAAAVEPTVDTETGELTPPRLGMDLDTFATFIVSGVIPDHLKKRRDVAIDSTDYEAHSRRRSRGRAIGPDLPEDSLPESGPVRRPRGANEQGYPKVGADGRLRHSHDPDAREGYRSGKNFNPKGIFIGWDLHFATCVPEDNVERLAPLTIGFSIRPAGSYKADSGLAVLDALEHDGRLPQKVLVDRGYSYLTTDRWAAVLGRRGVEQVFDLHATQRGVRPGPMPATIFVDGSLFIDALPERLRNLPGYQIGDTAEEIAEKAALYDQRLPYLFARQGRPDLDRGTQRVRGPALTDRVRCPNNPKSLENDPATRPTLKCAPGGCSCGVTRTLGPDDYLNLRQEHAYGTTAWKKDYNRRNHVESYNASLRHHHSRLDRSSTRVLGTVKTGILLAFLIAANNIQVLIDAYEWDPGNPVIPGRDVTWRPSRKRTAAKRPFAPRPRRKHQRRSPAPPAEPTKWRVPALEDTD